MKADPYLFFGGKCAEAIEYYRNVLAAEVRAFVRFGDLPGATPDAADKVMHAELNIDGSTIFVSDGGINGGHKDAGYSISLQAADDVEAERLFSALGDGGSVEVPLMTTPFASRFGMATDRFGIRWMITTPQPAI